MAKLSYVAEQINEYLKLHGDKELTSISAHQGCTPVEFTLYLRDIGDYKGDDKIVLIKNKEASGKAAPKDDDRPVLRMLLNVEEEIHKLYHPLSTKLTILWGALAMAVESGELDWPEAKNLWSEFALESMERKAESGGSGCGML